MFLGVKPIQETRVQSLKEEFDSLKMKNTETVEDYAFKFGTIVIKIRELWENIEDSYIVKRILHPLPDKFLQIVCSIKQFVDLDNTKVEELIGRLKVNKERVHCAGDEDEHVLLTRA